MLINELLEELKNTKLIIKNDRLLLGLSGGSDSIALLFILKKLQTKIGFSLGLAHLNHALRGFASDKDERFVRKLAEKYQLPVFTKKVNIKEFAKEQRLSLEDGARRSRYDFFIDTANKNKFNKVALAHTQDDQVETVLLKLLRGSGLTGLCGMPQVRPLSENLKIIRPLLNLTKNELLTYCRENKLKWREDRSNQSSDFTRNRLRNKIIPLLKKINPGLNNTFIKMTTVLKEDDNFLTEKTVKLFKQVLQKRTPEGLRLDIKTLLKEPLTLQRRVVRYALELVQGDLTDVYLPFIDNFLENKLTTVKLGKNGKLHVSKEKL
jgi:tRNA(Ile)-lysidine synthase